MTPGLYSGNPFDHLQVFQWRISVSLILLEGQIARTTPHQTSNAVRPPDGIRSYGGLFPIPFFCNIALLVAVTVHPLERGGTL